MNKNIIRIVSIMLAGVVFVCSLAILPYNTITSHAEVTNNVANSETDILNEIAAMILEDADILSESYIYATDLHNIAVQYAQEYAANNVTNETKNSLITGINTFTDMFSMMLDTSSSTFQFISAIYAKIGLFARNASILRNIITKDSATNFITIMELLRNGFTTDNKEIVADKVYTVSPKSKTTHRLKKAAEIAIKEDRAKIYTLVPTCKISEVTPIVQSKFTLTDYITAYLNCIQFVYDKIEDNQVLIGYVHNKTKYTTFYIMNEFVIDSTNTEWAYFKKNQYLDSSYSESNGRCLTSNDPTLLNKNNISENKISYGNILTGVTSNAYYILPLVTKDGRPVKIWASESMYKKYSDWSSGCPYDILVTSGFYDASNDNKAISILGKNIGSINVGDIYNGIVNKVVENNDYSDNSVQNIAYDYSQTVINNYYITEGSDEPTEPSVPDDPTPDKPNSDMLKWLLRAAQLILLFEGVELPEGVAEFLMTAIEILPVISEFCETENIDLPALPGSSGGEGQCTEHINGFVEEIDSMGELFPSLFDKMAVWKKLPNDVGQFVSECVSWLPPECIALIVSGVAAMVGIGIWKMIRG